MINVSIENFPYELTGEDSKLYELVHEEQSGFDGEKGSVDIDVVIRNKEDNTFWKCTITNWGYSVIELYEDWSQVYPHETRKVIYKSKPA
jgi:hypothetical protein